MYTYASRTVFETRGGVFVPDLNIPRKPASIFQSKRYGKERCAQFNFDRMYKEQSIAGLALGY